MEVKPLFVTIDANIIIAFLTGEFAVVETLTQWRRDGVPLFLSSIAEAEVLAFPAMTRLERERTIRFLEENFVSVPFDRSIARLAADIRSRFRIRLPDAAIAATAMATHTSVVTRNTKDFRRVEFLDLVNI